MKPVAWEAEDGTIFSSEAECRKYEGICRKKRNLKSSFYCQDGLRLFPEVEENLYSRCWYVYIADKKEISLVNELLNTEDFTTTGTYIYDDEYGKFRHINELYEQIHKAIITVGE